MGPLRNSRRTSVLLDMGIGFDALRTVIDTSPRRRRPCLLCSGYPPMGICPWRPQDLPGMTGRFDQPMHGSLEASPWRGLQWKGLQRGGFDTDRAGRGFVSIAAQFFGADHRQRDGCIPATSWAALGHAIAIPGHAGGLMAVDARHLVDGLMGLPQMRRGAYGQVLNAAQFTPHAHRGAADLLKLSNAPGAGPGLHP